MEHEELLKEINQLSIEERNALLKANLMNLRGPLFGYVFRLTRDEAEADEIVSETFLHLLRHLDDLREPGHLYPYLFQIARNLYRRRERVKPASAIGDREVPASEVHTQTSVSEEQPLSQRLRGILKFDGDPPNDEEVKDLIADYLIRKYS